MNWTKIALFILQHVSVHLHMYKSSLAQFSLSNEFHFATKVLNK